MVPERTVVATDLGENRSKPDWTHFSVFGNTWVKTKIKFLEQAHRHYGRRSIKCDAPTRRPSKFSARLLSSSAISFA